MEDTKNNNKEQERWVPVPDEPYNGTYLISNMGRIKNKNTGQIKTLHTNQGGFTYVRLDMGKKYKKITYQIHQLVARMFNGECPRDNFVVHKDFNKLNNSASNLTYMTKSAATQRYHNQKDTDSEEKPEVKKPEVKKVISVKEKQKLALEKNSSKKVISDDTESENDTESESENDTESDSKKNVVLLKKITSIENQMKSLEEELKSLKKQLNIPNKQNIPTRIEVESDKKDNANDVKIIPGFSKYEIDKKGNIFDTNTKYNVKSHINVNGYCRISLTPDGKKSNDRQNKYVHRLVAEAFIPNPKNLPYVNHINANKQDNRVENLEWCTSSENMIHDSKVRKTGTRVYAFDAKTGKFYKSFDSIKAAGREIGVDSTTITKVISGDRKLAGGYFWKKGEYENENEISDIDEKLLDQVKKQDRYRKKKIQSESEDSESE